jgi:hypothetical protein
MVDRYGRRNPPLISFWLPAPPDGTRFHTGKDQTFTIVAREIDVQSLRQLLYDDQEAGSAFAQQGQLAQEDSCRHRTDTVKEGDLANRMRFRRCVPWFA